MFRNVPRGTGVLVNKPRAQAPNNVPNLTVLGVVELQFFAVNYVERGEVRQSLFARDRSGVIYLAKDSDEFCASLAEVKPELAKNIAKAMPKAGGQVDEDIPLNDSVDVAGAFSAEEDMG